jgi:hypothetical protein
MSRKAITLSITGLALVASLGAVSQAAAQNGSGNYPLNGVVYVETNNSAAGQNAVLAFRRSPDGQLRELESSPYLTGGTGVRDLTYSLATFANDTPVIANREHTLLFAVNEGSNSIAVFHIGLYGDLTPVAGSPFASHGYQPVSLALVREILTVVNKNGDPAQASAEATAQPNYTTFRVEANGALTPNANSTVTATASPSQAVALLQSRYKDFESFGYDENQKGYGLGFVFGADFAGGKLQSFELADNGTLRQNQPLGLPANLYVGQTFEGGPAPAFPLGLMVHPQFPILYVGLVTINKIGVYVFGPDGTLNFVDAVDNPAPTNCWFLLNKAATRMYVVDTASNQVTTFDVGTDPLVPKALGVTQLKGTGFGFELALSDDGRFLYVISQQSAATGSASDNALHVLQVGANGDSLTEIETDLLPSYLPDSPEGTRWQGVVAF